MYNVILRFNVFGPATATQTFNIIFRHSTNKNKVDIL